MIKNLFLLSNGMLYYVPYLGSMKATKAINNDYLKTSFDNFMIIKV